MIDITELIREYKTDVSKYVPYVIDLDQSDTFSSSSLVSKAHKMNYLLSIL